MEGLEIKKKRGISPIWILPIIALFIGGWLLYRSITEAGVDIVVHFKSAEGITPGKTRVIYKGIPVGLVKDVEVDPGVDSVSVHIEMNKRTKEKLVEDLKFWIVRPEFSGGKIYGLGTILSGAYIAIRPGVSKRPVREFTGLEFPPPISENAPGLHIKLKAEALGSIRRGSGIFYRNIQIGSVQEYRLLKDNGVLIRAFIEPQYAPLVRKNTRFYDTSGFTVKGSLSGIKVHMESISTLIYGGIGLFTPKEKDAGPAQSGDVFTLYNDRDDAEAWDTIKIHMPAAMGIGVGTKLVYKGVEIGSVAKMTFDGGKIITAFVQIQPEASFVMKKNTKFWIVKPQVSINRIANLETMIKGTYITCRPGDGEYADEFDLKPQPRMIEVLRPGRRFILITKDADSLSLGAPIFYKKIKVGEVTGFDLTKGGEKVQAEIFIDEKYQDLVKESSVFWKYGGITIDANWEGIWVETGTLTSVLTGGITFTNIPNTKNTKVSAEAGRQFRLYENFAQAVEYVPGLKRRGLFVRLVAHSLKGVSIGSPVTYKHVKVGEVTGFELSTASDEVELSLLIQNKYAHLLNGTSLFWKDSGINIKAGLDGVSVETGTMKSIIGGEIAFMTLDLHGGKPIQQPFKLYESLEQARAENPALQPKGLHILVIDTGDEGLEVGSPVLYKRIQVGEVTGFELTDNGDVKYRVFIKEHFSHLVKHESRFYNLSGISVKAALDGLKVESGTLKSIVSGGIGFISPATGQGAYDGMEFKLYPDEGAAKYADNIEKGLNIVLTAPSLGSISRGSPILYKQIVVGCVTDYKLSDDASHVEIVANIRWPYNKLVFKGTRFWNASGIHVRAGIFSGVKLDTESIETIMTGGIAMATPECAKDRGRRVHSGALFKLYAKAKDEWKRWSPAINIRD